MIASPSEFSIFYALKSHRSRASVAAIGHHFVLNGAPPILKHMGIDALVEMPCDWCVAILEEAINDVGQDRMYRVYALSRLGEILIQAINHGYSKLDTDQCSRLIVDAGDKLKTSVDQRLNSDIPEVEELCNFTSEAIEEGYLGAVPDF